MRISPILLLHVSLLAGWALAPAVSAQEAISAQGEGLSLRARFERLDDAGDLDGIVALWRSHPGEVLYTIDAYLEDALALRERDPGAEPAAVPLLHTRALRAALAADRAFDRAIFSDYAAAFAGWSEAEAARFRRGQHTYEQARAALSTQRFEDALRLARECVDLAEPLGDWWGTAAGLAAEGAALEELGRLEEAVTRRARSRLLFDQLGLAGSELRDLVALGRLLERLDRPRRARVAIESGIALAVELEVDPALADLLRVRASLEERAGELEAAQATLRELLQLLAAMGAEGAEGEGDGD